jgi:hypothetical protein
MDHVIETPETVTDAAAPTASVDSSAGLLAAGLGGLLLAGLCLVMGQYQALTFDGYGSTGVGWLIAGAVLGVIAAVVTIVGVYVLASHVDNLTRAARGLPLR